MSYCVNCGVELDATRAVCPLCNTPVYHPGHPVDRISPTAYPAEPGRSEQVDSRELTSLVSIIFLTASVVCGLLNWLVVDQTYWSLYIIGFFVVLWVFLIPVFFRERVNSFVSLGLDGLALAAYVGMISILHPGRGWYMEIALPIIAVGILLMEIFYLSNVRLKTSVISRTVVVVGIIAVIAVLVEVLIGFHFDRVIRLTWSAVILSCCVAIDGILIAIALHKGARNELRRRMHF